MKLAGTSLLRLRSCALHKVLITVQPQFTFFVYLSSVFSVRAGTCGIEDFGTAGRHQA